MRVSTDEQAEHGYSLQSQEAAALDYAAQQAFTVTQTITDDGHSGATLNRPGLDELRRLARQRHIDAVIIHSPDRLTRNLAHSLLLREELQKAEVELHYCNRGMVEDTPEAKMQQNIEAVFADYWRAKIVEGSRRGRLTKAANGKWPGDGHAPYGYRKKGKGREAHLVIDEAEATVVRRIFAMYTGLGSGQPVNLQAIAAALTAEDVPPPNRGQGAKRDGSARGKGWYRSTVRRILTRRIYLGEFKYGKYDIALPELAIISAEIFQKAQRRRAGSRAVAIYERKYDALLAGHIKCSCGRAMAVESMYKGKYLYYACGSASNAPHLKLCGEKRVRANGAPGADKAVWAWLHGLLTDEEKLERGLHQLQKQRARDTEGKRRRLTELSDAIRDADRTIDRLVRKYAQETNDRIAKAIYRELKAAGKAQEALTAERESIEAELMGQTVSEADMQAVKDMARQVRGELEHAPFELKRQIMNVLDVRIELAWHGDVRGLECSCNLMLNTTPNASSNPIWIDPLNLSAEYLSTMTT